MNAILKGSTDVTRYVVLLNTDGTPSTAYTITDLDLQYVRTRETPAAKVDASALGATNSAHADNSAIEVDTTDQPGLYRVDWPDAAFATGADGVILTVKGTGIQPAHERIDLVNFNSQDGVRLGLTALPAAAADAAGGLIVSDAGGLDADAQRADVAAILVDTGTTLQAEVDGIQADTEDIQNRLPVALVGGRIDATVDGTGMEAAAVDNILDEQIGDSTVTLRQLLRLLAAVLGGKASGLPGSPVFRNIADTKDVLNATTDADGNRTAITRDLT